ncbi:lysocardiolipin acyltransferase 1 isoform X4 [Sagmatias obliquidens]|uniref:lysocardiolipin acyltransferase 1 isoform X4 n=1 Tax=Sagmatias obliquidens TaxID=3371155 RepID=UPI000F43F46E|nr:lysocardiolipin acyltransferase 1 isoform X4 [Lagenorhynchus obliquidens]
MDQTALHVTAAVRKLGNGELCLYLCTGKGTRIMVSWRGIYFILTLFWGSFFGSIFMLGPFLPLMFINPSWYRWINNRLVATWLTLPVALLETMFGVKVIITGDAFVPGERSVIIMNHRTRMDWMFLWNCLMRYSYLRLEKICLKATLKRVPGFGWAMQAAAYIFIHRKWKDDKSHFEDMIDYFCDIHEPLQLLIFPEGTDLTENSTARSNEFAEKNGLQKYEYVLHPRTTGFTFVVDRLREDLKWPLAEDKIRKTWLTVSKPGIKVRTWMPSMTSRWHTLTTFPRQRGTSSLGTFPRRSTSTSTDTQWTPSQHPRRTSSSGAASGGKRRRRGCAPSIKGRRTFTLRGRLSFHLASLSSGSVWSNCSPYCTGPCSALQCACSSICTALFGGIL